MAYLIEKTFYNGYKCACCLRTWDYPEEGQWVETLEEANGLFPDPTTYFEDENGDVDPYRVEVTDGRTGAVIWHGKIDWPLGYDKYLGERFRRWHGVGPKGAFEEIYTRIPELKGKGWAECIAWLDEQKREKDLKKAREQLAQAQARLNALEK